MKWAKALVIITLALCCVRAQLNATTVSSITTIKEVQDNAPKVLVTNRSPTSITIAFDDFKLPNYESGYVIQYKLITVSKNESSDHSNSSLHHHDSQWTQIQANNTPFVNILNLHPHSAYQIQVLVWEDRDTKKLGAGSEVITVFTEDGCFRNNQTYLVGQEFFEGCELRCVCRGSDDGECSDRCVKPLIQLGSVKNDSLCIETVSPDDNCCAIVKCTQVIPEQRTRDGGFTDKPGVCPNVVTGKLENKGKCKDECQHDYHCTGHQKCCKVSCGAKQCLNIDSKDVCLHMHCGPNAECFIDNGSIDTATCQCKHGFTGDPNDKMKGCKKVSKPILMCIYKDKHYSPGETFYDGCESKCLCSEALEVECSERCTYKGKELNSSDPLCSVVVDPKDNCCNILACESKVDNSSMIATIDQNTTISSNKTNNQTEIHHIPKPVEGCTHNNLSYSPNDMFYDGCEARCLCQEHGHLQCVPRCALDPGYDETYCRLVADPEDPECCKIAICDKKDINIDKTGIIIDSAEAYNSTSVKLRVMVPNAKNELLGSKFKVLYRILKPNETESEKSNETDINWDTIEVIEDAIRSITTDIYEIDVEGMTPQTDYFMKINLKNVTSNTVFVRTYPPGIDITFNGCFHGNRTFDAGEVFFDGCEYKCVCREGGLRECEERCPIYIDTVGYENCDWGPAPDDSCCTIPICDKGNKKNVPNEPDSEPFCISEAGKVYRIGQSWDSGTNCLRKTCKCALLGNGTTAVQCKGGCASLPPHAQNPTPECPSPQLITPDDPCLCPYVVCQNNLNPFDLPDKPHSRDKTTCEFKGKHIAIGEEFYDGCRAVCHCGNDARFNCAIIECPHHFSSHVSDCLEWDIDPKFVPRPPMCCPPPKCKNDGSCGFAGMRFPNFKHIPQELLPCGTRCACVNGNVTCENRCPNLTDIPPMDIPCPHALAYRGHLPGDNCCLHWLCRDPEKSAFCLHNQSRYKVGEQWDDKGVGYKRRCQCKSSTNGRPQVQCYPGGCQPITDRFLQPSVDCPNPTVIMPDDPVMCPYVICNDSQEAGRDLEHVTVVELNATTVRVRFTLPSLLVGLVGHAELHFTSDPNLPRSQWHVQKFARPKRLFDTANIEYHLGGLRPDTTYLFQIQVIIEALQSGPESEVYKLHMPSLPTTTSTTVPPILMLDPLLNVVPEDAKTLRVSWRSFTLQEKQFIDGIQIRHKKVEDEDDDWQLTAMLHRDVSAYLIRDLQTGASYVIDLVFITNPQYNTHIVSTKPIIYDIPPKPKDEYDIHLALSPNDVVVTALYTEIKLKNIPHPINKYINVAKINYRSDDSMEQKHIFKVINERDELILDGLEPEKRYKAWIDLYLTNGRTVSSNAFEFTTKERPKIHKTDKIDTRSNEAEALRENEAIDSAKPYYIILVIVSLFAIVLLIAFATVLYVLLRKQSTAIAPITRNSSESAYDNPTYKTYDAGERPLDDTIKNGSIQA